jgi:dTDP-4-amino-4,6-dideoxygalactose transaminase
MAQRVDDLGRALGHTQLTSRHRLDARRASFAEMLEAYLSEFEVTTLDELRRELRGTNPSRPVD